MAQKRGSYTTAATRSGTRSRYTRTGSSARA